MEALGGVLISRSVPQRFSGAGTDVRSHNASSSSGGDVGFGLRVYRKSRKLAAPATGVSICEFREKDHLEYYSSGGGASRKMITCGDGGGGVKNEKEKEKVKKKIKEKDYKTTKKMLKKRLKMLEGLSGDLSMLSSDEMAIFGFGVVHDHPDPHDHNVLFEQVKAKMIAEAAEVLQGQLQQLMTEKELKMRQKDEKISLKKVQNTQGCEMSSSSSSSSESSDSDCGEAVDMNCLNRAQNNALPPVNESLTLSGISVEEQKLVSDSQEAPIPEAQLSTAIKEGNSTVVECVEIRCLGSPEQGCCSGTGNVYRGGVDSASSTHTKNPVEGVSSKKIEVCMGGKCKKSGAAALLWEFQRLVGIEGAVSGCKCMGKCRDGPNVRILDDSVKTATNPLCIGVGLEDVDLILANFIRESSEHGLSTAAS